MKGIFIFISFIFCCNYSSATKILIPMDLEQNNHLKSYGIAYWTLKQGLEIEWLLNYRGGSFIIPFDKTIESECKIRGVSFQVIATSQYN